MAILYVNTGSSANKGDGDNLRTAFNKINANFSYLGSILSTSTSGAIVTVSSFPPNDPTEGEIWWNLENGIGYIYYTDLDSGQWVSLGNGGGGGGSVTSILTTGSGLGFSLAGGPIVTNGTISLTVPTTATLATSLLGTGVEPVSVGFRNIPQNLQNNDYTLVAQDSGKHIFHSKNDNVSRTYTIPSNDNVNYPIGTSIMFVNESTQTVTINATSATLYLVNSGTTGVRTLSKFGIATILKVDTSTWFISGHGVS